MIRKQKCLRIAGKEKNAYESREEGNACGQTWYNIKVAGSLRPHTLVASSVRPDTVVASSVRPHTLVASS
jgi:hypothetical protein